MATVLPRATWDSSTAHTWPDDPYRAPEVAPRIDGKLGGWTDAELLPSFAELDAEASRIANALLAAGVGPGQRIAYLDRNAPEYFLYLLGGAKVSDKIGINAQVGYRIFPNTIARAGLIESSGGIGIDHSIQLWNRPLTFILEAYDFARPDDESAHLRFEGRYFLNRNLFLSAGWDDPLVSDRSSVLFGGGITWSDDDIQALRDGIDGPMERLWAAYAALHAE